MFGSRGVLGMSWDKFYTQHHALSVALGVDFIGASSSVGYKYFSDRVNNQAGAWGQCLFLFDCDQHLYGGMALQHAGGTTVTVMESGATREYTTDPKWLAIASVGSRDVFKNNFTLDFEVSYRSIITGGGYQQTMGSTGDDVDFIEMGYRSVGFGVALGYQF